MVQLIQNNIFNINAEALVNTVNTVGVMGKGLALQFKNKYPEYYSDYKKKCEICLIRTGVVDLFNSIYENPSRFIISFPTKQHWKYNSKIEWIESGLINLNQKIIENNIQSIVIPPLGCGLGGLNFDEVYKLITSKLNNNINIFVITPK